MVKKKSNDKATKRVEPDVFINPKTDFGFKKIFGNKTLLISFLLTILPEDITDIEYLPVEQLGYIKENRKAIYDVYCTTSGGERFIVEMQASPQPNFAERVLLYMSYPIISQAPKGKVTKTNRKGERVESAWDYSIKGVYIIAVLDFILYTEKKAEKIVVECVKLVRTEANIVFTDKLKLVTIELPKFGKKESELVTLLDKWLYSLKNMEKLPGRPKWSNDGIFEELYENAKINNLTEKEMKTYKKSIMEYDDVILAVDYAEERGEKRGEKRGIEIGRTKGREEGRKEERINFVRTCYENGINIEQIVQLTGLTERQIYAILSKL
jgi:predicted transposase/invertase (TIGR01784 family)